MKKNFLFCFLFWSQIVLGQEVVVLNTENGKSITLNEALSNEVLTRMGQVQIVRNSFDDEVHYAEVYRVDYPDAQLEFIDFKLNNFTILGSQYVVIVNGRYQVKVGDICTTFVEGIPSQAIDIMEVDGGFKHLYWRLPDGSFCSSSLCLCVGPLDRIESISWSVPI